ncbi:uncharacterized protein BT62DRAFT_285478 [Guyanagaster necrorhizus]|uniref:Uncharacterized protein n=1 Tax=Guyanagaster necrorhizus TaxID=856835 RepID=A0A9P7W4U1_9AGAR|nr:uncharacterized protein BT62DRAFT_285478 [Guyanagaster necrorhizus MCA 3950]KAG7452157.1 hypothetical protein BT62DRAFT_285478 [Guyanagaster necrorhizus MCA 3950]
MSQPLVVTSRSTLMHASLAYLSDEIRTLDSVITSHLSHSSLLAMPIEILLLIRSHLLLAVTTELINRSTCALKRYESTLRALLCADCIAYNQDVYGKDIWEWEQFSGACSCTVTTNSTPTPRIRHLPTATINPKRFVDRVHWLEYYLSRKSLRLLRGRSVSLNKSHDVIWGAVSVVLGNFGCKVVMGSPCYRRFFPLLRDKHIVVVPEMECESWSLTQVTLNRVDRDLGLSLHHPNALEDPVDGFAPLPSVSRPFYHFHQKQSVIHRSSVLRPTMENISDALNALFAIPIAFMTFILAILCFYSRPGAFRIM